MANIPISAFTAAVNTTGIGMSGFSLTGSNAQSMLDLAGTWNTSGTPTALKLNVTDTASNAASLLIDLQMGGTSRFKIAKDGSTTFGLTSGRNFYLTSNELRLNGSGAFSWSSNGTHADSASGDLFLTRDAANTLAQRNGVNAQTLRVYNTFTDASNYERLNIGFSSGAVDIAYQNAGSGSARYLRLEANTQINFKTSGVDYWSIQGAHLFAQVDNTSDIGAAAANRPRRLYLGGGSLTGSQADSSLSISPTWNTTGTPTAIDLNVTDTASNAASLLMNLRVGGVSQFRVSKAGATTTTGALTTGGSATIGGNVNLPGIANNLNWGGNIVLVGDANNTLAQRNGTAAQAFNIYNTFTDASNYERGFVRWSSNVLRIGTEAAGTGTARNTEIVAGAFTTTISAADGAATFGGAVRLINANSRIELSEVGAPAAPAADRVRIYAEDNGSGKTRLMALFATGAAQQIAIEP